MSWADIIFPGNQEMRVKMVQKLQQLEDAMKFNFRASNKLATYLNTTISGLNLPMITVESSKSLKENANTLVRQINLIDVQVEKIAEELKKKLAPDLYEKLTNVDTSFEERIEISQKVGKILAGITGATVSGVVGKLMAKKLTKVIASKAGRIAASSLAGAIAGGLAGLAVDVIVGSITGAVERDELQSALSDLETMVKDFIPESEVYSDTIYEVLAEVKIYEKYHPNE
jgi:translation initiation factor 1 (eIF-1/SUI1)